MNISHLLFGSAVFGMVAVPVIATTSHAGIPSERNPKVIEQINDCPDAQRNSIGLCPRSFRMSSSWFSGGSFSSGK